MGTAIYLAALLALWTILMSFIEHAAHKYVMHGKSRFLLKFFYDDFDRHTLQYHRRYYRVFNHEPDDRGRWTNIHFGLWPSGGAAFLIGLIGTPLFGWLNIPIVLFVVTMHHIVYNAFHEAMHIPGSRFYSNWRWYRYSVFHHFMHHRYPGYNYNLSLPFADFILGTYMKPSAKDLEAAKQFGIL